MFQVFHICDGGRKISFLCPNGTVFRQSHLICDWWFRVDCGKSVELYEESAEQLAADQRIYRERAEAISRAMHKGVNSTTFDTERTQRRPVEQPSVSQQNTKIDAPAFATARQNFEMRQTERKQNASQQRRKSKSQPQQVVPIESRDEQLETKNSEQFRTNEDDQEQQVLSETASFASSRGSRFGNQFLQNSFSKPSPISETPQTYTSPSSASTSRGLTKVSFVSHSTSISHTHNNALQSSSQTTPLPFSTSYETSSTGPPEFSRSSKSFFSNSPTSQDEVVSFSQSTTVRPNENTFSQSWTPSQETTNDNAINRNLSENVNSSKSSQELTPSPQQRNIGSKSQIPTSSQNNNFRFNTRNGGFKKNRQFFDSQKTRSTAIPLLPSTENSISSPSSSSSLDRSQNVFNEVRVPVVTQKSFIRPSPDLIPPQAENSVQPNVPYLSVQNNVSSARTRPTATVNSKRVNTVNRNRFTTSSTKRPSVLSSPSTTTTISDGRFERMQKSRRFSSTTEKPVFTAKFRPSKTFSYVELERAEGSLEQSTPYNASNQNTPQLFNSTPMESSVSSQTNPNNQFSTKDPSNGFSNSYSSTGLVDNTQPKSFTDFENSYYNTGVTESQFEEHSFQTEWTPTRAPHHDSHGGFLSTSITPEQSYSPTLPDQVLFENNARDAQQSNQQPFDSSRNQETLLDKLADFSNIDPAEINLLPAGRNKPGSRVPDSAGPNALHTLALYYATSEKDTGTTPAYSLNPIQMIDMMKTLSKNSFSDTDLNSKIKLKEKSKVSDEILLRSHSGSPEIESEVDGVQAVIESSDSFKDLSSVLTKATKDSYSMLFNQTNEAHVHTDEKPCSGDDVYDLDSPKAVELEKEIELKTYIKNDLESEQSRGIVQPTPTTRKPFSQFSAAFEGLPDELKLRDSTDLRELAQVFSRALSAYLEDPDNFRKILSEVRPTEPTNINSYATLSSLDENEDEVLDFSDNSNTGSRLISNNYNGAMSQNDSVNSEEIQQINDLLQGNNSSEASITNDLTAPPERLENTATQFYSTVDPSSFAVDINLLSIENNHTGTEPLTEESYFPTAGGVDDQSRPRYGGFHNNSASSNYKPYGSDILNFVTGNPITETNYVTDGAALATSVDDTISETFINNNFSSSASNQIDIESIPDQLGIVPAEDINSLLDNHNNREDHSDAHGHFITEQTPLSSQSNSYIKTEEEIYGRGNDQEKLLIASGSQSLVSRDNYIRFIGSKQDNTVTKHNDNSQNINGNYESQPPTSSTTQEGPIVKGRGGTRFDPSSTVSRSEKSSIKKKQSKEIEYQNVNLGNGVTLERTKTIRYSTPTITSTSSAPIHTEEELNLNPVSINAQLGFPSEDFIPITDYPFGNILNVDNRVRATTYHPSSSHQPEFPSAIPPRGSLRESWNWNSQNHNSVKVSKSSDSIPTRFPIDISSIADTQNQSFTTFTSTLLPPNVTIETAGEEMLERKAEEIFGKLNKTSTDMLMNVMNQAESNMTVRRLVLLLVADRNGRENKSYKESRSQLIQALLKTSESLPESTQPVEETTQRLTEKTVSRKSDRQRSRSRGSSTTSSTPQTTTVSSRGRRPKAYRGTEVDKSSESSPKSINSQYLRSPNLFAQNPSVKSFGADPDARAVELLKSLYNLAARWG